MIRKLFAERLSARECCDQPLTNRRTIAPAHLILRTRAAGLLSRRAVGVDSRALASALRRKHPNDARGSPGGPRGDSVPWLFSLARARPCGGRRRRSAGAQRPQRRGCHDAAVERGHSRPDRSAYGGQHGRRRGCGRLQPRWHPPGHQRRRPAAGLSQPARARIFAAAAETAIAWSKARDSAARIVLEVRRVRRGTGRTRALPDPAGPGHCPAAPSSPPLAVWLRRSG